MQRFYGMLPPIPAVLGSSKWCSQSHTTVVVYEDHANIDMTRSFCGLGRVFRIYSADQSKIRVVGNRNGLVKGVESGNGDNGTEDLLPG